MTTTTQQCEGYALVVLAWYTSSISPQVLAQNCCPPNPSPIQLSVPFPAGTRIVAGYPGSWHCSGAHIGASSCAVDFNVAGTSGNEDEGTPVFAAAAGTVKHIDWMQDAFGHYVVLDHNNGIETWYAHLQQDPRRNPGIREGDRVRTGNVIGFLGTTGKSTTAHLHFELRQDRTSVKVDMMDGQSVFNGAQIQSRNIVIAGLEAIHPDGTLLKPADTISRYGFNTIFYVENQKLRPFTAWDHYRSWLFHHAYLIVAVSDSELAQYESKGVGPPMSFRPGTVLKSNAQGRDTVYVIEYAGGLPRKRPFTNWERFVDLGYSESTILRVEDYLLAESLLPTARDMTLSVQTLPGGIQVIPTLQMSPAAGQQGTTFVFTGSGYTPGGAVKRYLRRPGGGEVEISTTLADSEGNTGWSYASACTDSPGTYSIAAENATTGLRSNSVSQSITASPVCLPLVSSSGNIIVDGNPSDWSGIEPVMSAQAQGGTWSVSITDDGSNVYFLAQLPRGETYMTVYFNTDSNPNSGCRKIDGTDMTMGADYAANMLLLTPHLSAVGPTLEDDAGNCKIQSSLPNVLHVAAGDQVIEASLPVSLIAASGVFSLRLTYPFNSPVQNYTLGQSMTGVSPDPFPSVLPGSPPPRP